MKEIDPVCGMEVDPKIEALNSDYKGKTYYFCSMGCKKAFDKEPEKYIRLIDQGKQHMHHH